MLEKYCLNPFIIGMMSFTGTGLTCIRSDRVVFQKLNFSVTKNEILYVKGPNGSGKSTLLRVMAGLLRPAAGELYWNGEKLSEIEDDFKNAIKGALSVKENLKFWASMLGKEDKKDSIDFALETFNLRSLANLPARFLSEGQTRRLNLARLSTTPPTPLWILDEPDNSLDESASMSFETAMASHIGNGGMVVMATHQLTSNKIKTLDLTDFSPSVNATAG